MKDRKILLIVLNIVFLLIGFIFADDIIDYPNYRVIIGKGLDRKIVLSNGEEIVSFFPQSTMPEGGYGNFYIINEGKTKITESLDGGKIITSISKLKVPSTIESVFNEQGIKCNIECKEKNVFYPDGQVKIFYEFENKGDDIFFSPYINFNLPFESIRGMEGEIETQERGKSKIKFPTESKPGIYLGIIWGVEPKKEKIQTFQTNTKWNKPINFIFNQKTSAYIHFNGSMQFFHVDLFNWPYVFGEKYKRFPTGSIYSVEVKVELPLIIDIKKESKNEKILLWPEGVKDVYLTDNFDRPEIKKGTFYQNGKFVYLIGPFTGGYYHSRYPYSNKSMFVDDPFLKRYYEGKLPDKKLSEEIGFSTSQITSPCDILIKDKYFPELIRKTDVENFEDCILYIKSLEGLPIVPEFTRFGPPTLLADTFGNEILQQNPSWHEFVPFCPENPKGKEIYENCWQDISKLFLSAGGNPYVYELFNEAAYNCRCSYNRKLFLEWISKKYKSIENANNIWQTNFSSLAEAIEEENIWKKHGVWIDWLKFQGDRWADIIKDGCDTIRKVDKRENIYFTVQPSTQTYFLSGSTAIDLYKEAQVLDIICCEGGINFGQFFSPSKISPLEEVCFLPKLTHQLHLDFARALSEDVKPIIDNELNIKRYSYLNRRIPSKREDFPTALWTEVIHGASQSILYSWDNRPWEWKTLEEAKEMVKTPSYKDSCLLNPYNYPPETLYGIKDFAIEISSLSDIVLPQPRIQGKLSILISQPTMRYSVTKGDGGYKTKIQDYYEAITFGHYSCDILYEEQLPKGIQKKYKVIIIPGATNIYPETISYLEEFIKNGGIVILDENSLQNDEYGKKINIETLLGIKSEPLLFPLADELTLSSESTKIPFTTTQKIELIEAEIMGFSRFNKAPLITCHRSGLGKVYYIAGKLESNFLISILTSILKNAGIDRDYDFVDEENKQKPHIEIQMINRENEKLFFLVNWSSSTSQLGKLQIFNIEGEYYVCDPIEKLNYGFFNTASFKEGILLHLKPEVRKIVLITKKPWCSDFKRIEEKDTREQFLLSKNEELKEQNKIGIEIEKSKKDFIERNTYVCSKEKTFFIDISQKTNMGFTDKVEGDRKGGAFDQGSNDLREFPTGKQILAGVPFLIINPEENNGTSCIVLKGKERDYFPEKVTDIEIKKKGVKYLYFLHTVAWGQEGKNFSYWVHYKDGSSIEISISGGMEVSGWWNPVEVPNAKIAWEGKNECCSHIGVYCYRWENPKVNEEIKSIDIISANVNAVPCIIAITGELM